MNTNMLEHPAVGENVETLVKRGARFVEPGEGFLACGWVGKGRLAEPEEIVAAAESILRPATSLRGRRVLVTAGPTCEDLDPVRYLGNRSSGRMGFAVAAEAVRRGADVTLVSGPTAIDPPQGTEVVRVRSAAEMHRAVTAQAFSCDAVVMAAAVADYTPETVAEGKLTKRDEPLLLRLAPTRDILGDLGAERARRAARLPVLVGFAAETADLVSRARQKLQGKQLDLVVGNDVSQEGAGFDVATNAVTLVDAGGELALPRQPKAQVARAILDRVEALLSEAGGPQALPPRADGGQASAAERT
jgi:phosphopantothenoylcysteine decarboxylase/phosphopantothenate--cysteine ligase